MNLDELLEILAALPGYRTPEAQWQAGFSAWADEHGFPMERILAGARDMRAAWGDALVRYPLSAVRPFIERAIVPEACPHCTAYAKSVGIVDPHEIATYKKGVHGRWKKYASPIIQRRGPLPEQLAKGITDKQQADNPHWLLSSP